jgi:hypothetical protein
MSLISGTIAYLRRCQAARAAGYPVSTTTDPKWLVNMAINRRAGWPDDPGLLRGSAMPVNGRYPARASDQRWSGLHLFARAINTPRRMVRRNECRHIESRVTRRLDHRFD